MKDEDIFVAAIEIEDLATRQAYLDEVCAGDATLRASVDELLSFHESADGFLETPALETEPLPIGEDEGTVIDRYQLVKKIGEGGFGDVWKAEQLEPVKRFVALKVIKPGMDTRRVITRFEAERQVLAMMNHRNIAAVLDAGSTNQGRPYFVMELVDGPAIDVWCDQNRLSLRKRLELFVQICRAVQHAHQKGIVHRDLKPTNILVTGTVERPEPKVIDFGIAKAMQNADGVELSATGSRQMMGTPEYMSPEQIAGDTDIDTRADVYALGGVLYKLLVGVAPLESETLRKSGFYELVKAIRESEPQKPSTRILKLEDSLPIAEKRKMYPDVLSRQLSGDLDAIVTMALAKERARRYASAIDLARDIGNYLDCRPVNAAPPSSFDRTAKFVRRHRMEVLAATTVCLAIVVVAVMSSINLYKLKEEQDRTHAQWTRAERERIIAREEREQAELQRSIAVQEAKKSLKFAHMLEQLFEIASPTNQGNQSPELRAKLDSLANSLSEELEQYPDIESRIRVTVGQLYLTFREWEKAGPHLQRVLELRRQELGETDPLTIESRVQWAEWLHSRSRIGDAEREIENVIDVLSDDLPNDSRIRAVALLASIRRVQGEPEVCLKLVEQALSMSREIHGENHPTTIALQSRAAYQMLRSRRFQEAFDLSKDSLERIQKIRPQEHMDVAIVKLYHARVLFKWRDYETAEELVREAIEVHSKLAGEDSIFVVNALISLARIYRADGRDEEAVEIARDAVEKAESGLTEQEATRSIACDLLAKYTQRSAPLESMRMQVRMIEAKGRLSPNHPELPENLQHLALHLRRLGHWDESEKRYLQALKLLQADEKENGPRQIETLNELGDLLLEMERPKDAEKAFNQSIALSDSPDPALLLDRLHAIVNAKEIEKAREVAKSLTTRAEREEEKWWRVVSSVARAQLSIIDGDVSAAKDVLEDVLYGSAIPTQSRRLMVRLIDLHASCLIQLKQYEDAEANLLRAAEKFERRSFFPIDRRRITQRIVKLYSAWERPEKLKEWKPRLIVVPETEAENEN